MNRITLILMFLTLLLFCVEGCSLNSTPPREAQTGSGLVNNGDCAEQHELNVRVNCYRERYNAAQWRYSWAHHFCIFGAAILSALAALLSKIHVKMFGLENQTRRDNWTASLAAVATLLIAISTAGKFGDSWQRNEARRYAVESLQVQLAAEQNPSPDELEAYGKKLAEIIDPKTTLVIPASPKE